MTLESLVRPHVVVNGLANGTGPTDQWRLTVLMPDSVPRDGSPRMAPLTDWQPGPVPRSVDEALDRLTV